MIMTAVSDQHDLAPAELHGAPFNSRTAQTGTWGMLRRTIEAYPERTALVVQHQPYDVYGEDVLRSSKASSTPTPSSLPLPPPPASVCTPCVRLSYAELNRSSRFVANDLHQRGIGRGATVLTCLGSQVEFFLLWWACARLGAVLVPLSPLSLAKKQDMEHFLRVSKASVVCVQSDEAADTIDKLQNEHVQHVIVAGTQTTNNNRTPFSAVLQHGKTLANDEPADQDGSPDDPAVMLFTSGTTGLPKSVVLTCVQQSGVDGYYIRNPWLLDHLGVVNVCLCLPLNHVLGYYTNFLAWFTGGCSTYPAATFDVEATLHALAFEKCNWFPLVPSLAVAMANHQDAATYAKHINIVMSQTGGANVTMAMLDRFRSMFDVEYSFIGFGLTECVPCASWDLRDETHRQGVGSVHPGTILRIADPESRTVLKRGQAGELWVAGIKTIAQYGHGESADSFISAPDMHGKSQNWMRTGDYAMIDEQDNLHILSRIKDIIIRGGENLSAPRIEGVLEEVPSIKMAQVIGVKDERAGEVPVALVESATDERPNELDVQRHVVQRLGVDSAPVRILTLKDINVDAWPMTLSRKVQKVNLVEPVEAYMSATAVQDAGDDNEEAKTTLDVVRKEWTALVPMCAAMAPDDERLLTAISSMESTAFVGRIRKRLGKTLSIAMLQQHPSMTQQAKLLDSLSGATAPPESIDDSKSDEVYRIAEGDELRHEHIAYLDATMPFNETKKRITTALRNIDGTLPWSTVESVFPASPTSKFIQIVRRPRGGNHRHNFLARKSPAEVRHCVREAVRCTPMLRCFAVALDERWSVFVVLRATDAVLDMLVDEDTAATRNDIVNVKTDDAHDGVQAPGMLTRFSVVTLSDAPRDSAGLVMWAHHSAFDFDSLRAICERLDAGQLVHRSTHLDRHMGAFGEHLYRWTESQGGRDSVAFHVKRLAGFTARNDFWPPQRAPEWMKGCDSGWLDVRTGKLGTGRTSLGGDTKASQAGVGTTKAIHVDFTPFRKQYTHVFPAFIVKAALVAMNWHATGSADVVFGQYENGRAPTPDMPSGLDLARIDGPLMEMLLNRIAFDPKRTTVLQLIEHVQQDQFALMPHAHASIHDIMAAMQKGECGATESDAKAYPDVLRRQLFNWFSNYEGATRFDTMERINFGSHTDLGVLWTIAPRKDNTLWLKMAYDFCQLSTDEAEGAATRFLCAAKWFADPSNANALVSGCDFACGEVFDA